MYGMIEKHVLIQVRAVACDLFELEMHKSYLQSKTV